MNALKEFLAEFWLWMVIPAAVVLGAVIWLLFLSGDDSSSPFVYNVF